ncbi:hypothetical protein FRB90_004352 [Tulasnella sp. 427]|nr:hypothetical protein FRB90_004352 [Tulasnella sp. 427]
MVSAPEKSIEPWLSDEQRFRINQAIANLVLEELSKASDNLRFESSHEETPEMELEVVDKVSVVLNTYRNRLVRINRLPLEILDRIFEIFLELDDIYKFDVETSTLSSQVGFIEKRGTLQLVSRAWNAYVVSTPHFWTVANLMPSVRQVISKGLERAGSLPLCLSNRGRLITAEESRHLATILSPYFNRIRTLQLRNEGFAYELFNHPLPDLRILDLYSKYGVLNSWPTLEHDFPGLHTLRLSNHSLPPQNAKLFSTLRVLHVGQLQQQITEVLGFLSNLPNLEDLAFWEGGIIADWKNPARQPPAADLPKLECFLLRQPLLYTLKLFLTKLRMPNVKRIVVIDGDPDRSRKHNILFDVLGVLRWGFGKLEVLLSENSTFCKSDDGRIFEVRQWDESDSRVCVFGNLQSRLLSVTAALNPDNEWWRLYKDLDWSNVVELREVGGTLSRRRALLVYLAAFREESNDAERDTDTEEEEDAESEGDKEWEKESAEEGGEESAEEHEEASLELQRNLPFPGLDSLILEGGEVELGHLIRMLRSRASHPQAPSTSMQRIKLINCDPIGNLSLGSSFAALGVDLIVE